MILPCDINFNRFDEEYENKYFNKISNSFVLNSLGLDESTKIKRNGTWTRTFIFVINGNLVSKRIRIQKMLWYDACGHAHYISVFPSFIIKYCPLSSFLLDFVISNVKAGEDILNYINDPDQAIDCEDPVASACSNLEKRCINNGYLPIVAHMYTSIFNKLSPASAGFNARFPKLYSLFTISNFCFGTSSGVFSRLNASIKL